MSYCRFGPESEVYAWEDTDGFFVVWTPYGSFCEPTSQRLLERFIWLGIAGVRFPDYVFEKIADEMVEDGERL